MKDKIKLVQPSWMEVNYKNLKNNLEEIRRVCRGANICAVVKANAYGLGSIQVVRYLESQRVDYFAVSTLNEAIELREAGIESSLMTLTAALPGVEELSVDYGVETTIYSLDQAQVLNQIGKDKELVVPIHIKIDTGMNRIGFKINPQSLNQIEEISQMENICIKGIFTHFASADVKGDTFTNCQFQAFEGAIRELEARGVDLGIKHVDNDAALMMFDYREDMVRSGIGLYGIYPSDYVAEKAQPKLKPVASLKSTITQVKELKKGETVGYGQTYTLEEDKLVATVGLGYGDGYPRYLSNKGRMIVNGVSCPIIGRVCMDQTMIDVSGVKGVKYGDEAICFGEELPIEEISDIGDAIMYEVITGVARRVPRVYIDGDKGAEIVEEVNYLFDD